MSDRSMQTVLSEAPKDVGAEVSALPAVDVATPATIITATLSEGTGRKRGPVPKRRFQKGSFQMQNGRAYTLFYEDVERPDGTITTQRARHLIGDLSIMSERAARREHDLFMAEVNRRRGSVPVPIKGGTFRDAVDAWKNHATKQVVSEDGDQHLGDDLCSAALCEKVRDQDESGFFFGPDDPEPGKSRASVLHS